MANRFSFDNLPIGRKLLLVSLVVIGVMLVGLTTLSIAKEFRDWQRQALHELTSNAKIMGANTAPALLFSDPKAASEVLSAMSAAPSVVFAGVYDANGARFAFYGASDAGPARLASAPQATQHTFSRQTLVLSQPIVFKGERVGSIYLKSDLRTFYGDILTDVIATLVASVVAFAFAVILFQRMQRNIVRPIRQLSEVMTDVSVGGNYAVRAKVETTDEVGALAKSFNGMLEVIQDRDTRLAHHQEELEETVRQRTGELNQSNSRLEQELVQRREAQEALRAHDAMLKAVAHSASELLSSLNLDEAIASVLELIGQTLAVSRVHLGQIKTDREGHLRSVLRYEWRPPGRPTMLHEAMFKDLDITAALPALATSSLVGERTALTIDEVSGTWRELFERAGMKSMLFIPVMTEDKLWGGLWFMDSAPTPRPWNWAETDTLATLAGLIGVSTTRARYMKELADANTIVLNSPTVLYRLKGEPNLPFSYISQNISKFGYDSKTLLSGEPWFQTWVNTMVHPDDRAKIIEAMLNVQDKNASGATIEIRLMLPTGTFRWVENRYTPVRDELGRLVEIEGIIMDVTERKAAEEKIALLARTDVLTGLANRATFVERLHQAFVAARRGAPAFAVHYLDLDHFKDVNDTRGHPVGDLLLREAGERLKSRVRETDLVARLGGDEFAVLQADIGEASDAGALAADLRIALAAPYVINGAELHLTASIGISPYTQEVEGPDAMLAQADLALYRAKEDGRDQYRFHSVELDHQVSERVRTADDLRKALKRDELYLHYQPQVELMTGRIVGMEALVRWHHPTRGDLQPADFISIAEGTGVIQDLGRWVLEHACRQMKLWKDQNVAPAVVAVNISMLQLKNGAQFVRDVTDIVAKAGIKPEELELDVTESILAKVTLAQNDVLDRLKECGIRIALDDFGTDYSSFEYLRAYHVNHLKVAREFIENATKDTSQAATVRAIIGAARELGIQVIAEGVETKEQRALLLALGPDTRGQGFYFSEPVEVDSATALLKKGSIDRTNGETTAA